VIVDGADNFPTRYPLVNDAAVWHDVPARARLDLSASKDKANRLQAA